MDFVAPDAKYIKHDHSIPITKMRGNLQTVVDVDWVVTFLIVVTPDAKYIEHDHSISITKIRSNLQTVVDVD